MLEAMPVGQFLEWQAFFRIRAELENPKGKKQRMQGGPNVGLRLLGALKVYQKQRDKLKAEGRLR